MITRGSKVVIVIMFTLVCLFATMTAHAAGGTGRIAGRLVDGTKQNVGVAGQVVTLQMEQGNSAQDVTSATTDGRGGFSFTGLSTDKTIYYALYTRYQGAQYTSNLINLASKAAQQVDLVVYEATSSTAKIVVQKATILLQTPDAKKGTFAVSEVYTFYNLDTRTYVGSLNTSAGMPNALRFSLPHTARNVSLGAGFNGYQGVQVSGGFASDVALVPGNTALSFTFEVPFTTSNYDFDYAAQYPTVQLVVLIPPDIHASSDVLKSQGVITADQQLYQQFQAIGLRPTNGGAHVELQGLPSLVPDVRAGGTQNTTIWWLLAIVLGMLVIVGGTWYVYRRTMRGNTRKQVKRAAKNGRRVASGQGARENDAGVALAELDASGPEQKVLLRELLSLDKEYEAGKLAKAVYEEQRAKTKAKLRALMKNAV